MLSLAASKALIFMCCLLTNVRSISGAHSVSSFATRVHLILGSGSWTRREILVRHGFHPEVRAADIDEKSIGDRDGDSHALVLALSQAKSRRLLATNALPRRVGDKPAVLLTADQVVVCNHTILEKPTSPEMARAFMHMYSGGSCATVGSLTVHNLLNGKTASGTSTATISFHPIPADTMSALIQEGTVLRSAGALVIERPELQPYLREISGSMDSVLGLSCDLLETLLNQVELPSAE